ncbi:MAG: hypothetical protein QMD17_02415 [Rhodocyclaceae bacterium]|nr:hypothetical protein [Rhodocyclaceae bacterium]
MMRQIELDGSPNDVGWVLATMHFPNDQALREQYFAVHLARYEEKQAESYGTEIQLTRRHLSLLIDAPSYAELGKMVVERTKQAIVAGDMMATLYVMDYFKQPEPSMNKAEFVASEFSKKATYGDGSKIVGSHPMIMKAWNAYRDVAHLWAAFRINEAYAYAPTKEDIFSQQYFPTFLGIAAMLHEFGTSFTPLRAKPKKPILDKESAWQLPPEILPVQLTGTPSRPTRIEKTLKKYRAES